MPMKAMTNLFILVALLGILIYSAASQAQDKPEQTASVVPQSVEKVQLTDVLEAVRKNSKKTFLINHHVQPEIVVGQIAVRDIDYALLLQILRNNDLAAVTVDGAVNVIPVAIIRQYPLPAIPNDDSLNDEEWVTGVLPLENAPAPSIVPIMRPMMPQAGHLAAYPYSNSVIIVDRLGNARRILNLIRRLDQATSPQTE